MRVRHCQDVCNDAARSIGSCAPASLFEYKPSHFIFRGSFYRCFVFDASNSQLSFTQLLLTSNSTLNDSLMQQTVALELQPSEEEKSNNNNLAESVRTQSSSSFWDSGGFALRHTISTTPVGSSLFQKSSLPFSESKESLSSRNPSPMSQSHRHVQSSNFTSSGLQLNSVLLSDVSRGPPTPQGNGVCPSAETAPSSSPLPPSLLSPSSSSPLTPLLSHPSNAPHTEPTKINSSHYSPVNHRFPSLSTASSSSPPLSPLAIPTPKSPFNYDQNNTAGYPTTTRNFVTLQPFEMTKSPTFPSAAERSDDAVHHSSPSFVSSNHTHSKVVTTRRTRKLRPKVQLGKGAIQCHGMNRKKGIRCRNAALMEYFGTQPLYCAEHIDQDPECLYTKCKSPFQKVPGDEKGCREVVLKEFGYCHKHFDLYTSRFVGPQGFVLCLQKLKRVEYYLDRLEKEAAHAKGVDPDLYQRKNKLIPKFQEMCAALNKRLMTLEAQGLAASFTSPSLSSSSLSSFNPTSSSLSSPPPPFPTTPSTLFAPSPSPQYFATLPSPQHFPPLPSFSSPLHFTNLPTPLPSPQHLSSLPIPPPNFIKISQITAPNTSSSPFDSVPTSQSQSLAHHFRHPVPANDNEDNVSGGAHKQNDPLLGTVSSQQLPSTASVSSALPADATLPLADVVSSTTRISATTTSGLRPIPPTPTSAPLRTSTPNTISMLISEPVSPRSITTTENVPLSSQPSQQSDPTFVFSTKSVHVASKQSPKQTLSLSLANKNVVNSVCDEVCDGNAVQTEQHSNTQQFDAHSTLAPPSSGLDENADLGIYNENEFFSMRLVNPLHNDDMFKHFFEETDDDPISNVGSNSGADLEHDDLFKPIF